MPFGAAGRRLRKDDSGQSIVELALMLPLLVFFLIGGADVARAFALQLAVQNGARAGAEAVAIDFSPTQTEAIARARDEMDRTPGMTASSATVTVLFKKSDGTSTCDDPPTATQACFATVRVVYAFNTIIPWPFIPNSFTFDRQTTMRTIKGGTLP